MKISEVMTRGAECTRPGATLQEAAERMRSLNVGALPVCDNDRLVGVITDRDITVRATGKGDNPMVATVGTAMTPKVVTCFEDQNVEDAARLMEENQSRRLAVLNRAKRLVGIVSLGDLAVKAGDDELSGEALEQVSEPAMPHR